jgi:hypothetical protein
MPLPEFLLPFVGDEMTVGDFLFNWLPLLLVVVTPFLCIPFYVLSAPQPLIKRTPWGLTYANVRPLRENSIESLIFLGTNVAFFVAGVCIASAGNPALGLLAELAGTASIGYHWAQVKYGGTNRPVVQSLLLIDYALALPTFFFGILYAMQLGSALPLSAVIKAIAACAFFGGAICVKGPRAYMVLHGMWHILGPLAGRDLALAMATMAQ